MKAREYRELALGANATAADAKALNEADGRRIANKTRSKFFTWILSLVEEVQATAIERSRREDPEEGPVEGMFEYIAASVSKYFAIGAAAIGLVGFVIELHENKDAVRAMIDLWSRGLIEDETIGSHEASGRQQAFMERGKALRTARNWAGRLKAVGILSGDQLSRIVYKTTNAGQSTLATLMFQEDINAEDFKLRLLGIALHLDASSENEALKLKHYVTQFSLYMKVLAAESRSEKAKGNVNFKAVADATIVQRIFNIETVFNDPKADTTIELVPETANAAAAGAGAEGPVEGVVTDVTEPTIETPETSTPEA